MFTYTYYVDIWCGELSFGSDNIYIFGMVVFYYSVNHKLLKSLNNGLWFEIMIKSVGIKIYETLFSESGYKINQTPLKQV